MPGPFWCRALVALALGGSCLAAADDRPSVASTTVEVQFVFSFENSEGPGAELPPLEGSLELVPATRDVGPLSLSIVPGDEIRSALREDGIWRAELKADGFWSPGTVIAPRPGTERTTIEIPIWRASHIVGELRPPKGDEIPERVSLRFWSPPTGTEGEALGEQTTRCPVDSEGGFACTVPAVKLDLAVRAAGFISRYFWGLTPPPGGNLGLGILSLRKGASLTGWAEVEDGRLTEKESLARLIPRLAPGGGVGQLEARLRSTTTTRKLQKNGFFHFDGVPPGSYVLAVEHPGYATAQRAPVEIYPDAETRLPEPVILHRPLDLEFVLSPPTDWRGKPWNLEIFRAAEYSGGFDERPSFSGVLDATGRKILRGQSPGLYSVTVSDSTGNRLFAERGLIVETEADALIPIEIDLIAIEGEVSLGEEPLQADLFFGGRHGAQRVAVPSDEDGFFEGFLPREGIWRVTVEAAETEIDAEVHVDVRDGRRLEIKLPDTEAFGRVVDQEGQPVVGARVSLSAPSGPSFSKRSETDGEFSFRGFPAEPVELVARLRGSTGTRSSDGVLVPIQESLPAGPIELVLRHGTRRFSGKVLSPRGAVAGAQLWIEPAVPGLGSPAVTRSGLDGGFAAEVPERADRLRVVIMPPGHALETVVVSATDEPALLDVAEIGGTLEVAWSLGEEERLDGVQVVVLQEGQPVPMQWLGAWSRGHGYSPEEGCLIAPQMALGSYRACVFKPKTTTGVLQAGGNWLDALEGCVDGYLSYGETLRLEVVAAD